jgi:hypothetical protein
MPGSLYFLICDIAQYWKGEETCGNTKYSHLVSHELWMWERKDSENLHHRPQCGWCFGVDTSLLCGKLLCALWGIYQHFWPLHTRHQWHLFSLDNWKCHQTLPKCPLGRQCSFWKCHQTLPKCPLGRQYSFCLGTTDLISRRDIGEVRIFILSPLWLILSVELKLLSGLGLRQ